jgi:hypothetical protein
VAQLLRHCATSRKEVFRFPMVSLEFFIDVILPAGLWPWGDSASNRNEHRIISYGKGGWCLNLTSQPSCAHDLEICVCNIPVQGFLDLYVKCWTEMSKFESILQLHRPNSRKVYRITTNFVRYTFGIMNSRLFTNPSFSQNIFTPYWTQRKLSICSNAD